MEKVDYKKLSDEVYEFINVVREDPKIVLDDLKRMKKYFKGKEYRDPKLNFILMTQEGVDAVDLAIKFISNKVFKKNSLERSSKLDQSA